MGISVWARPVLMAVAAAALAGCATKLEVERAGESVASRSGFAYPLQFTQYQTTITRRVASCDDEGLPVGDIKAEVIMATVDDGDHIYVVKPERLMSATKVTDIQMAWEEGRLTSINASAEDRTGQTMTALATGVGKLLVSGALVGVAAAEDPKCSARTDTELQRAKDAQGTIKRLDAEMAETRLDLERVGAKLVKDPENVAWLSEQQGYVAKLEGQQKELNGAQKALKSALEFLTHKTTITWPETGRDFFTQKPFSLMTADVAPWVEVPRRQNEDETTYRVRSDGVLKKQAAKFDIYFRIERIGSYGRDPVANNGMDTADSAGAEAGLRYRLPAQGRLVVCQKALCTSAEADNTILKQVHPVLQLGQIFYVPFRSPVFSNGSMNLAFDKYGRPTSAGIKRATASAETAANTFRDVATEASGVIEKIHQAPLSRLKQELEVVRAQKELAAAREVGATPLELIQKETALLKATKDLTDARGSLETDPLEQIKKETELANAQAAYQVAMKALESDPSAARRSQTAGFQADAAVALAEKAKIEADMALAEVRAKQK
jgi:hypothetical protein